MSTLIAYTTRYGSTEKCAQKIAEGLNGEVEMVNLKEKKNIELSPYNTVIIGGPIYMGKIQKEVAAFCSGNIDLLKNKKLGLFICCMKEGEDAETQLKDSFPEQLFNKAVAKDYFGGEFNITKMIFLHRLIVKILARVNKDTSNILEDHIIRFREAL